MTEVAPVLRLMPEPKEGSHGRSQRLLAEAKQAADEHVAVLQQALFVISRVAAEVGNGGEVYPVGVRDLASKISGDAAWCGQTMQTIMRNVGRPTHQDTAQTP